MDPQKVAAQAQNMSPAARIALPALVAGAMHQQKIQNELKDTDPQNPKKAAAPPVVESSYFMPIPDGNSYIGFSSRMIEEHFVEREAMKVPRDLPSPAGAARAHIELYRRWGVLR